MPDTLLKVEGLQAWYGELHILHGVNFEIGRGELVTLLGRNGAGKTTTLKSIMGIVGKRSGSVRFEDGETVGKPSDVIARLGLAYCPEERGIFASLNVEENLLLPPAVKAGGMSLAEIYRLFPNLAGAPTQPGHQAVGRRAADAGDRPHPAHWRQSPAARRADRGPGAGDRTAHRRGHPPAQERTASPSCWSSRTSISPPPSPTATM